MCPKVVYCAGDLAEKLGAVLEGNGALELVCVADLREAEAGALSFAGAAKYFADVVSSKASAVLVPADFSKSAPDKAILKVKNVDVAFMAAAALFAPPPITQPVGIHPTAVVAPDVKLGKNVSIGALAVVEAGAEIGDDTVLFPHTYVGHETKIGRNGVIYPFASIRERCELGDRVILHNGVVIGSDGFGYAVDTQGVRTKIPQTGIVVLGDDVEIGANATIDRARFGRTVVEKGCKVDNLVQIAHNCRIGEHTVLCAQVGIAGTTTLGKHVICAGQAGLAGHLSIGDGAVLGAQCGVPSDLPGGQMYLGAPAVPRMDFARNVANVNQLPKLKAQLKELQKRVAALEPQPPSA